MTRLAIVVEGRTETDFVKNVLCPHLSERGVYPYPNSLGAMSAWNGLRPEWRVCCVRTTG